MKLGSGQGLVATTTRRLPSHLGRAAESERLRRKTNRLVETKSQIKLMLGIVLSA